MQANTQSTTYLNAFWAGPLGPTNIECPGQELARPPRCHAGAYYPFERDGYQYILAYGPQV